MTNTTRTAKATATLIRKTDEKYATRLRDHGWTVIPPERAVPAEEIAKAE